MAAQKKRRSGKTTSKRQTAAQKKKKNTLITIGCLFLTVILLVYIFLSFYSGLLGAHGEFVKNMFLGLFGSMAYILPFLLIYGFVMYLVNVRKNLGYLKVWLCGGIVLISGGLNHLFYFGAQAMPIKVEELYVKGIVGGGGVIGGFIGEPLKNLLSYAGAMILLILILLFLLIFLFYEPLIKGLEQLAKRGKKTKSGKPGKPETKPNEEKEPETPGIRLKTDFTKIMEIFKDYEDVEEEPEEQPATETKLEKDLYDENEFLDRLLSGEEEIGDPTGEAVKESAGKPKKAEPVAPLAIEVKTEEAEYQFPSIELLDDNPYLNKQGMDRAQLKDKAIRLEETLRSFGVEAHVVNIEQGPTVTRFELQPKSGVKISKIMGLADDIALNLAAKGIRIAPIPGKTVIGVEVANDKNTPVFVKEVISSKEFQNHASKISFAVGKDIAGKIIVGDIAKMPHVLIAGATGSGKSVCINTLITSILFKAHPNEVKLIMIDPKVVELGVYNGIPHLLIPVVTDPKKAAGALHWAVMEMLNRYKLFADNGVRDIKGYNEYVRKKKEEELVLPQIVIIIDELADLMMAAPKDVEEYICRLAQLARAAGMHLVIATQRPSVDVITGLIKANVPSRIAFAVSSQVDSRTILDGAGAEKLLGKGDMLYYPVGETKPLRVQGSLITDKEVERIVNVVKATAQVNYNEDIMDHLENAQASESGGRDDNGAGEADELLPQAIEIVVDSGQASTSMLQRRLKLGYSRAARIVDQMEERGIVGPSEGSKPRQVLITKEQLNEMTLRETFDNLNAQQNEEEFE